jgi:hypothetical protein
VISLPRPHTPPQHAQTDPARGSLGRRIRAVAPLGLAFVLGVVVTVLVLRPAGSHFTSAPAAPGAVSAASEGVPGTPGPAGPGAAAVPSAGSSTVTRATSPPAAGDWPGPQNTGVPAKVVLHACGTTIAAGGTYDRCRFAGGVEVKADHVKITRSLITGVVNAGRQTGLVISDTTIDCGCLADDTHTPSAIMESNYTLLRVNIFNSGHGAAVNSNVTIQDSWIHGLGANTDAHKDGIYSGNGSNVVIRHNNIECNDGSRAGCTSAIGLLTDFGPISHYTIVDNLLNTNGSYCFYATGGAQKDYTSDHIVFTGNHFGRSINAKCGFYGPACNFDVTAPGNVWSGNVWEGTNAVVLPGA